MSGKNNPNWKGGKPKCIDCGKLVSNYGYKRCRKCLNKTLHPKKHFKIGDKK
jgi:hypothetical protein